MCHFSLNLILEWLFFNFLPHSVMNQVKLVGTVISDSFTHVSGKKSIIVRTKRTASKYRDI